MNAWLYKVIVDVAAMAAFVYLVMHSHNWAAAALAVFVLGTTIQTK